MKTTMLLVKKYGGTRVFVPKTMRKTHHLAFLLGVEEAITLSRHFGGDVIVVAKAVAIERAARNRDIVRNYDAGVPVWGLAQEHNLTERQIYTILSRPE